MRISLVSRRVLLALALGFVVVGSPLHPAWAADNFDRLMAAVVTLYEDLDYEGALRQLDKARRFATSDTRKVSLALHEGLVLADMGRREESAAAFRTALLLDPRAALPLRTSPKVMGEFEALREEVHQQLASQKSPPKERGASASGATAAPAPGKPRTDSLPPDARASGERPGSSQASGAPRETPSDRPEQAVPPASVLVPRDLSVAEQSLQAESRGRAKPVVPWVLLGAGVVAGGVGGYFGLQSQSNVQAARDAEFRDMRTTHLKEAEGQALVANILFGAAGAAGVAALVTFLTSSGSEAPATSSVSAGGTP